ncbi:MAG: hypothetical protein KDJ26_05060 [Alphaproteobacteria bacterium]|nr:hypothetical protein [Alphaproteobacteria bacterium]MCB1551355.1 hypothetical protein [Alphaproteobacteria bacterium]MCB9984924.1 hypothetical protein [Micavibrio sp.]HPQ50472.1 hypothetical protein [Alphaproteobacteria bacterium]
MTVDFSSQEVIGALAFIIRSVAGLIYIVSILQGKTKPHLFTWLIFTILTAIAFLAQISDNAGPGSWIMGIIAFSCFANAILALRYGEKNITRGDKIALSVSLGAILPWILTEDPLYSVILVSIIDAIAMIPTLRKSWHKPYEENLTSHSMATFNVLLSVFALSNISATTILYPLAIIVVNTALIILCLWRRRALEKQTGLV